MRGMVAITGFLVGCGYSTTYPEFEPRYFAVDTASPDAPSTGPDVPCGAEGPVGQLRVVNGHALPVTLSEVHPSTCAEVPVATLDVGEVWQGSVVTGRVWVARAPDGALVVWFSVPQGTQVEWVEVIP